MGLGLELGRCGVALGPSTDPGLLAEAFGFPSVGSLEVSCFDAAVPLPQLAAKTERIAFDPASTQSAARTAAAGRMAALAAFSVSEALR
jgi:hypothetical protein